MWSKRSLDNLNLKYQWINPCLVTHREKKAKTTNLFCLFISRALNPDDFLAKPHKTKQAKLQTSLSI